jgi:hypothetical protein
MYSSKKAVLQKKDEKKPEILPFLGAIWVH